MICLTIVIEQENEELAPSVPLETSFRLPQELARVDERPVLVEEIYILIAPKRLLRHKSSESLPHGHYA
jgi:hypothetical protein